MKAAFIFVYFLFLSAQAATGFMHRLFDNGYYPRAMQPMDWIIQKGFVGPFGEVGGAMVLFGLGAALAVFVFRHERYGRDG